MQRKELVVLDTGEIAVDNLKGAVKCTERLWEKQPTRFFNERPVNHTVPVTKTLKKEQAFAV